MLQSNLGVQHFLRDVLRGARLQNLERVSPHRIFLGERMGPGGFIFNS